MIIMTLSADEARSIVWRDNENYETIEETIVDSSRWSIIYEGVFKNLSDNTFWSVVWSVGATEQQYERPFGFEKTVDFVRVEPKEVLVTRYVPIEV